MSGGIPPLPHASMAWCSVKTHLFTFIVESYVENLPFASAYCTKSHGVKFVTKWHKGKVVPLLN